MEPQDNSPEYRFPYVGNLSPQEAQNKLMAKEGWCIPQEVPETDAEYFRGLERPRTKSARQILRDAGCTGNIERKATYLRLILNSGLFQNPRKYSLNRAMIEARDSMHFFNEWERAGVIVHVLRNRKEIAVKMAIKYLERFGG